MMSNPAVVLFVIAVIVGLLVGRWVRRRAKAVDKKMDAVQKEMLEVRDVLRDVGLEEAPEILGLLAIDAYEEAIAEARRFLKTYGTPEGALNLIMLIYERSFDKLSNNPVFKERMGRLISSKLLPFAVNEQMRSELRQVSGELARYRMVHTANIANGLSGDDFSMVKDAVHQLSLAVVAKDGILDLMAPVVEASLEDLLSHPKHGPSLRLKVETVMAALSSNGNGNGAAKATA